MESQRVRSLQVTDANGQRGECWHEDFIRYLPAVKTHAAIQFRHFPEVEREECVAEAVAAAFVNYHATVQRGKESAITAATLASYAVMHVKDMRHVGGRAESSGDVLSRRAQYVQGFNVHSLSWDDGRAYHCLSDPTSTTWRHVLLDDESTPVPEQAAFRIDWSTFLRQQADRTRRAMDLLAAGYRRCEVSDILGTTRPAVTQRMQRAVAHTGQS